LDELTRFQSRRSNAKGNMDDPHRNDDENSVKGDDDDENQTEGSHMAASRLLDELSEFRDRTSLGPSACGAAGAGHFMGDTIEQPAGLRAL
jgi:hypothetical protein